MPVTPPGRRFAAVSLMRIKAATQVQVAAAFDTSPLTLWRWAQALSAAGVSALVPHRKGPRRASKLTPEVTATIAVLREQGLSLRAIGERVAVSEASVRRALSDTETERHTDTDDPTTVPRARGRHRHRDPTAAVAPEPVGRTEPVAAPELGSGSGGGVPVLADPVDRSGERALAAFGLIPYAPPVFTPCGRAPLAGLLLARMHFDLGSHDSYRATDDDPDRMVPNPAKKPAYAQVDKAWRALHLAEHASDRRAAGRPL